MRCRATVRRNVQRYSAPAGVWFAARVHCSVSMPCCLHGVCCMRHAMLYRAMLYRAMLYRAMLYRAMLYRAPAALGCGTGAKL